MAQSNLTDFNTNTNSIVYLRILTSLTFLIMLCCLILFLARLGTWFAYAQPESISQSSDLWRALWTGFRFDLAILIRLAILGILVSIVCIPLPFPLAKIIWVLNYLLGGLIITLVIWLAMANFSYIGFFNRPIDSFAFSGMNYGAETIWPTVTSIEAFELRVALCIVVTWVSFWLCLRVTKRVTSLIKTIKMGKLSFITFAIFIPLMIMSILGRGTVSTFPLSYRHLVVSSEAAINNLVPNGIVALYYGYKEFKESKRIEPATESEGRKLFQAFYGYPATDDELFPQFFTHTKQSKFLEDNPPHVVLNLVESMANTLLTTDFSGDVNLAGELQKHLKDDYYFKRFLPAHDDTQKSLVSLLVNTEYSAISHSRHQTVPLKTSAARIFKNAGYRTVFVYAGFEGLSNRSNYFKTQGFDVFIGAHQLTDLYPAMQPSVWGGEDQFVFDEVYKHLTNSVEGNQPLFIVTLTVTNHPPYTLPLQETLTLPKKPQQLLARLQDLPEESLDTYLYTNDQLGQFISRIKDSSLKQKTIIAVTGDHAIRGMRFNDEERLHEISVPFYLYIPQNYKSSFIPDTHQIASHKDIMPTLYNTALSQVAYPNLGRNLLDPTTKDSVHNFASHADYLVYNDKAYRKNNEVLLAGKIVKPNFMLTKDQSTEPKELDHARFYSPVLQWLTRFQLLEPSS
ncbi:MAG: alkaline phosphatase family protein [SAR92 clade bacterium]|uniref:Alkaline phosphatase family protein n=1 Tax=SAR92 clade bacterium TaxID=2315479 RepID=A0A520MEG3_9GAMM|nr:MAG: alkaline phosphatase family protein [SAR92 clade bacterium]